MAYEIVKEQGFSIVRLTGEVDLHCSPEARSAILGCLQAGADTLVDLSAVEYIDSSGVASLVEGFQLARSQGLWFGLLGVSDAAMRVLQLARLDKVFPTFATLHECAASRA